MFPILGTFTLVVLLKLYIGIVNKDEEFRMMSLRIPVLVLLALATAAMPPHTGLAGGNRARSVLDFTMKSIDGKDVPLSGYRGKVLLIVNVASECGYTPQYKDLEALYRMYKNHGLKILAFPANNFGGQEPGTDAEIKNFCTTTYDVSFDLFSKISVKGNDQHPLYAFITSPETNPRFSGDVKWNFQKYLVDKSGTIIGKFLSATKPLSNELVSAIDSALK
jgi:glutathione peroxidase